MTGVLHQDSHALARVNGRTAADGNHRLGAEIRRHFGRFVDVVRIRVRGYFIVVDVRNAVIRKRFGHVVPRAGFFVRAVARYHDYFANPPGFQIFADIRNFGDSAYAEIHQRAAANLADVVNVNIFFPHKLPSFNMVLPSSLIYHIARPSDTPF